MTDQHEMHAPNGGGAPGRSESREERVDRNWNELLQEMRVTQAGVQILFGFLLTMPFQSHFDGLNASQRATYLAVLGLVSASAVLVLAPVMVHRVLFRSNRKEELLRLSHRLVQWGMVLLGGALALGVGLVVSVVSGSPWGLISGGLVAAAITVFWGLLPFLLSRDERP